jgi:carbamoylphosphate synthase large subunit
MLILKLKIYDIVGIFSISTTLFKDYIYDDEENYYDNIENEYEEVIIEEEFIDTEEDW